MSRGPEAAGGLGGAPACPGVAEPSWRRWALGPVGLLLAGVLHTASFAPTQAWPLQLLAMAWLVLAVRRAWPRPLAVAACGLAFGLGWMASALWWLFISLHHYGHLPAVVSVLSVLALSLFLALYPALALGVWARWGRCPSDSAVWPLGFASTWLLSELARGTWLSGFPWVAAGYAHTVGPFSALAPWLGVYGLAAVAAGWVAWWVQWSADIARKRGPGMWAALALTVALLGLWAAAPQFTQSHGSLQVTLLQPNVPQDQKFSAARLMEQLDALASAIEAAPPGLVVTPETAFPLTVDDLPPSYLERLQAVAQRPGTALLWGSFTGNEVQGYMNSMLGMTALASGPYVYGKRHLLPFGETIPPGFRAFVRAMNIPMDDQARGQHDRPFVALGQGLRPLICFEDLFAEEIAPSVAQGGATVLVNASNLAWFGPWMVQDQHLQFSQMRALEFQRPVVRSTNTGSTAVVDHRGQVLARLPPEQRGSLSARVEGRQGATPLAWWMARAGLWPLWALGLGGVFGAALWAGRAAGAGWFRRERQENQPS